MEKNGLEESKAKGNNASGRMEYVQITTVSYVPFEGHFVTFNIFSKSNVSFNSGPFYKNNTSNGLTQAAPRARRDVM